MPRTKRKINHSHHCFNLYYIYITYWKSMEIDSISSDKTAHVYVSDRYVRSLNYIHRNFIHHWKQNHVCDSYTSEKSPVGVWLSNSYKKKLQWFDKLCIYSLRFSPINQPQIARVSPHNFTFLRVCGPFVNILNLSSFLIYIFQVQFFFHKSSINILSITPKQLRRTSLRTR